MTTPNSDPDLLDEYDFSGAIRGKYAERFRQGTYLVLLDADVADVFPTARDVNTALRSLIRLRESAEFGTVTAPNVAFMSRSSMKSMASTIISRDPSSG